MNKKRSYDVLDVFHSDIHCRGENSGLKNNKSMSEAKKINTLLR